MFEFKTDIDSYAYAIKNLCGDDVPWIDAKLAACKLLQAFEGRNIDKAEMIADRVITMRN